MKPYRITEFKDDNQECYYTVEFFEKGILWGASWKMVQEMIGHKMWIPVKFNTLESAQNFINGRNITKTVIETGIAE
jgi:hypothetical protein